MVNEELKVSGTSININQLEIIKEDEKAYKETKNKTPGKEKENYRVNFLLTHNIKRRKDFVEMLKDTKFPNELIILTVCLCIFWIAGLSIGIIQTVLYNRRLNNIELSFEISRNNYIAGHNFNRLIYHVRDLYLIARYP